MAEHLDKRPATHTERVPAGPSRCRHWVVGLGLFLALTATHGQGLGDLLKKLPINPGSIPLNTSDLVNRVTDALAGSDSLLDGDKRAAKNGQGLGLTPEEQQRANQAAALFQQVAQNAPDHPPPASIYQPNTAEGSAQQARLEQFVKRYKSAVSLTPEQQAEARQVLQPFALAYVIEQANKAGLGTVVVPAHAVKKYSFAAYCNDHGLPAPKAGEQFQLVPIETLYPKELLPAYIGLMKLGATSMRGGADSSIQGLIWAMRSTINGQSIGQALSLSPQQQQLLQQADPNALGALQNYYNQARGQKMRQDAIRNGLGQIMNSSAARALNNVSNSEAMADVQRLGAQLTSMPVTGPVRGQNAAYTLLNDNVAAYATTSGGYSSADVTLANNSDMPTVFLPGTCLCQSTRPAQRLSLQLKQSPNVSEIDAEPRMTRVVWVGAKPVTIQNWYDKGVNSFDNQGEFYFRNTIAAAGEAVIFCAQPEGWALCTIGAAGTLILYKYLSPPLQAIIDQLLHSTITTCEIAAAMQKALIQSPSPSKEKTCDDDTERRLGERVHNICDSATSCIASDSTDELVRKIGQFSNCIDARRAVTDTCFGGISDKTHDQQIDDKQNAIKNCQRLLTKKGR